MSKDCGMGGSIADIAGRQATAKAATPPLNNSAATTPAIIRVRVIRPYSSGIIASTGPGRRPPRSPPVDLRFSLKERKLPSHPEENSVQQKAGDTQRPNNRMASRDGLQSRTKGAIISSK
jgi:hypothetical protein